MKGAAYITGSPGRQYVRILDAEQHKTLIMTGKLCPYCLNATRYVDSAEIYNGTSYGMVYRCTPCDAHVGVHKGTDKALGRVANKELREWKKEAHRLFDGLWKEKMRQGFTQQDARTTAYKWLSLKLSISEDECHIGMMDIDDCKRVVELCKQFYKSQQPQQTIEYTEFEERAAIYEFEAGMSREEAERKAKATIYKQ